MTTKPYLLLNAGAYPVAFSFPVGDSPLLRVRGEIYSVPKNILSNLDRLEGNGYLYERRLVGVQRLNHPEEQQCFMYFGMSRAWHRKIDTMPACFTHEGSYNWA